MLQVAAEFVCALPYKKLTLAETAQRTNMPPSEFAESAGLKMGEENYKKNYNLWIAFRYAVMI